MLRYRELGLARVGVIGLVLVIAIILAGLQFQKLWTLSAGVRYQAVFAEAGGLAVGDDVTMDGVTVGDVAAMRLDNGYVRVQFTVADGVRLGTDSSATIKTRSLLGKRMLTVVSAGGGQLRPSDTIPLARTASPYSLPDALGGLTQDISGVDTEQLNASLATLSSTLRQTSPELGPTFEGLTRLSQTINSRDDSLRDLLDSAGKVTGILADRSAKVNSLILNANDLVGELSRRRQAIVDLLANTSAVAKQLNGVVADNEKELAPTIERLNRVTAVLQKNKANIAETLPGLSKYATALGESVANGPYYNAYVGNLLPAQLLQPFLNGAFGLPPVPLPIPLVSPQR